MLRMILGSGRRPVEAQADGDLESASSSTAASASDGVHEQVAVESWIEWVIRTTRQVEGHAHSNNSEDWCLLWRRRVWRFAHRVTALSSGKWSLRATLWDASRDRRAKGRLQNRPRKRWADDICAYLQSQGYDAGHDRWFLLPFSAEQQSALEDGFLDVPM